MVVARAWQKMKVKSQLVQKIVLVQTTGRTRPIALPLPPERSVINPIRRVLLNCGPSLHSTVLDAKFGEMFLS